MPSTEPSPRPWRVEYDGVTNRIEVIDAEGRPVCGWSAFNPYEADHHADANLVVAAVNERAKFEELRMEFPDFRPVIIAAGQRDAAIAERDRLRDIVKRLSRHLANYLTSESENDLLREARAEIGEDAP